MNKQIAIRMRPPAQIAQVETLAVLFNTLCSNLQQNYQVYSSVGNGFTISLEYHAKNFDDPRIIDYKVSHINSLFYFGNNGFSGFGDLATKDVLDYDNCENFYDQHVLPLFDNYVSKHEQPVGVSELLPETYFLVTLQIPTDVVMQLKAIETEEMLERVIAVGRQLNVPVIVKRHPKDKTEQTDKMLRQFKKDIILTEGNIMTLIDNAAAVFTINSGTGFEALLKLKKVFTFGMTDYNQACFNNYDKKQIIEAIWKPTDTTKIKAFLQGYWNNVININDPNWYQKCERLIQKRLIELSNRK